MNNKKLKTKIYEFIVFVVLAPVWRWVDAAKAKIHNIRVWHKGKTLSKIINKEFPGEPTVANVVGKTLAENCLDITMSEYKRSWVGHV